MWYWTILEESDCSTTSRKLQWCQFNFTPALLQWLAHYSLQQGSQSYLKVGGVLVALIGGCLKLLKDPALQLVRISLEVLVPAAQTKQYSITLCETHLPDWQRAKRKTMQVVFLFVQNSWLSFPLINYRDFDNSFLQEVPNICFKFRNQWIVWLIYMYS